MKIRVRVKTHKKEDKAYWAAENSFKRDEKVLIVETKEQPVGGKANRSVIQIVANFLHTPRRYISIKSGHTSKNKTLLIQEP